jgi:hypothetical protein
MTAIDDPTEAWSIEVVRGRLDRGRADELLSFWAQRRALSVEEAQRRLPEVVCVLRQRGVLAGASSVYPAEVPLVGRRRFWIYRSLLDQAVADQARPMIRATFNALEAEFDPAPGSPLGLCVLVGDPDERRRHPQAEWSDPHLLYAGYLADGRQVRIAYFDGAVITSDRSFMREPGEARPLPEGYRIAPYAEQDAVGRQDVVELWTSEAGLARAEAERRVPEILLVATDPENRLVGVSTAYQQRNRQLHANLWYMRVFVASSHRRSRLASELTRLGRQQLTHRFLGGNDTGAIGIIYEIESEILKRTRPEAIWRRSRFAFIGEDARGRHVRVHYFPGALAPEPGQGSA